MDVPASNSQQWLSTAPSVGDALLTLAELELEFASSRLAAHADDRDEAVHQCRKAIKRLRAIARLGVAVPGVDPWPVDRRLRKAGRLLAPARDATAAANVLARLADSEPTLSELKRFERIGDSGKGADLPGDTVLAKLDDVRTRLAALFSSPEAWTFARMADGIEATYAAAVVRMNRLEQKHTDTRAHAWRKEVQRLLHQLGAIEALCPELLGPRLTKLADLADVLGKHHDLAVLRARLETRRKKIPKKTHSAVAEYAKDQQRELRRQALIFGADLFSQSPRTFRDSLVGSCGTRPSE